MKSADESGSASSEEDEDGDKKVEETKVEDKKNQTPTKESAGVKRPGTGAPRRSPRSKNE